MESLEYVRGPLAPLAVQRGAVHVLKERGKAFFAKLTREQDAFPLFEFGQQRDALLDWETVNVFFCG